MKIALVFCCLVSVTSSASKKRCDYKCLFDQAEFEASVKLRITELILEGMAPRLIEKSIGSKHIWVSSKGGQMKKKDMAPVWIGEAVDSIWGTDSSAGSDLYRNFPGYLCKRADGTMISGHETCVLARDECSADSGRPGSCEIKPVEQAPPQWGNSSGVQVFSREQPLYACMRGEHFLHIDSSCAIHGSCSEQAGKAYGTGHCKKHAIYIPLEYAATVEQLQKALSSLRFLEDANAEGSLVSLKQIQEVSNRFTLVPPLVKTAVAAMVQAHQTQTAVKGKAQNFLKRGKGRKLSEEADGAAAGQMPEDDHHNSKPMDLPAYV